MKQLVVDLMDISLDDVEHVGGKNASLGEMLQNMGSLGIKVPSGFATTVAAFNEFLDQNGLRESIMTTLAECHVDDIKQLQESGEFIRSAILNSTLPESLMQAITSAYKELLAQEGDDISVAVRSSATAEDLPDASFAGQQETFLNVRGAENIVEAVQKVFASLYTDRAIAYREHNNFPHHQVGISVTIQKMVRSDKASSGVMFTVDTESGFDKVVFITAAYGLGEAVVQGAVNPDEYYFYKPNLKEDRPALLRKNIGSKLQKMIYSDDTSVTHGIKTVGVDAIQCQQFCLSDEDALRLANHAIAIEEHYQRPMDIEWGKDGPDGDLYLLQARPETVTSRLDTQITERYRLSSHSVEASVIGRSIGQKIGAGRARVIHDTSQLDSVEEGDVLIADMTDPDWEPVMKKVSAIVTNRGGRTCHAAIIAREIGIPAVVGTSNATEEIKDRQPVTVSCAEGETGYVYPEALTFHVEKTKVDDVPELPVKVSLNIANPDRAFSFRTIPNSGVGLARLEFLISNTIGIHPRAVLEFGSLPSELKENIRVKTQGYSSPKEYYIEKLREGIATLAAAFYPKPVILRLSDFKSNEYANLLGGDIFEPNEENPMIGFRGCGRYISPEFSDCFALECEAVKRVRNDMALENLCLMIPFVRTVTEAEQVMMTLSAEGLVRGESGLKIYMMCELPSNVLLAKEFLAHFDGFSIGSNDLTQLTLGLDRDSALVSDTFDERNDAIKRSIAMAISACREESKYVGICGQGPSDFPDFAKWLVEQGIDSISLNPDSVIDTSLFIAEHFKQKFA